MLCYALQIMDVWNTEPSRLHGQDKYITWLAINTEQKIKRLPFASLHISLFTDIFERVMKSECLL